MRAVVVALIGGCTPDLLVHLDPPEGARSVLLIEETDPLLLSAFDLPATTARPLDEVEGRDLHALFFSDDLSSLQIPSGRVTPAFVPPDRLIPPRIGQVRAQVSEGLATRWIDEPDLPRVIDEIRLAALDPIACVEGGGCFESPAPVRCLMPCPIPEAPRAPETPRTVELPEPPLFLPCPEGWTELEQGTLKVCEPPPEPPPAVCASGEAQWYRQAGCTPVGTDCPSGPFPPWMGPAVYVQSGAVNGTGTIGAPFGRITDALSAPDGVAILVAPGVYTEDLAIDRDRIIVGACAVGTEIRGDVALQVIAGSVSVQNLTLTADSFAAYLYPGAFLELEDVSMSSAVIGCAVAEGSLTIRRVAAVSCGLHSVVVAGGRLVAEDFYSRSSLWSSIEAVSGATVSLDRFVLRDVRSDPDGVGTAILLRDGAVLDARRGVITGAAAYGIYNDSRSVRVHLDDVFISQTERAVAVGGSLLASRLVVEDVVYRALVVRGSATATVTDFVVRRTSQPGLDQAAIRVDQGARATIRRARIEDGTGGVAVADAGSVVDLADARIVRHTTTSSHVAVGVWVEAQPRVRVARTLLQAIAGVGILATSSAAISLEDVSILETKPSDGGFEGRGLYLTSARGTAHRVRVDGAVQGILIDSAELFARDLTVESTLENGVLAINAANISVDGLSIAGNLGLAVLAHLESVGSFLDVTSIGDSPPMTTAFAVTESSSVTLSRASFLGSGDILTRASTLHIEDLLMTTPSSSGVRAVQGSVLTLRRVEIADPRGWGLSSETESDLEAEDVSVRRTVRGLRGYGSGFLNRESSTFEAKHFLSSGSVEHCVLHEIGSMRLSHGIVEGCPIGAEIRERGEVGFGVLENVLYRDSPRPIFLIR